MDEGVPESSGQRNDHRTFALWYFTSSIFTDNWIGLDDRLREAKKCSCALRSRVGADDRQGNETNSRHQKTKRAHFLEEQVWHIEWSGLLCISHVSSQDGCEQGEATRSPSQEVGRENLNQVGQTNFHGSTGHIHGAGKNQSSDQIEECSGTWRGSLNGYGGRLSIYWDITFCSIKLAIICSLTHSSFVYFFTENLNIHTCYILYFLC